MTQRCLNSTGKCVFFLSWDYTEHVPVFLTFYPGNLSKFSTVSLLNSPWSSPKKYYFRKFWRSYLDQNLHRITNPVSDLTGDQWFYVNFRSCNSKNHNMIFKFVGEILPIQPTIQTPGKKSAPPLFFRDDNIFQKSARVVRCGISTESVPREPIFKKCSHLREKGDADAFINDQPFRGKRTVQPQIYSWIYY